MADVLVAPDCVRYTVNQQYLGRPVASVIDMVVINVTASVIDRAEAVRQCAGDVMDAWDQNMLGAQSNQLAATSVSWVDLNSEDGSTGSITSTADTSWPNEGGAEGDPYAASVAYLFTKATDSARGSRTGRLFMAGATEQNIVGNLITTSYLALLQEAGDGFTESLTETGFFGDYNMFPTVIHTKNVGTPSAPVIEYVNNTQVTSFQAQRQVASQRRRNRP